jgi:hypothetical protein
MTDLPPDPIDPYERRLAARVRAHAESAVEPIDASAIVHAAAAGQPPRGGPIGAVARGIPGTLRLAGVALVLVAVVAIGSLGLRGNARGPGTIPPSQSTGPGSSSVAYATLAPTPVSTPRSAPTSTPAEPTPSPATPSPATPEPGSLPCDPAALSARVTSWTGAAGNRIADIELRNDGVACSLPVKAQVQLIDGNGRVLIEGPAASTSKTISLDPGATATTLVDDANYCGPDPTPPVTVAFVLPDGGLIVADAPTASNVSGVPPCNGPGMAGSIQMHTWKR